MVGANEMRWVVHAMERPGAAAARLSLGDAHGRYVAACDAVRIVIDAPLLQDEAGAVFGHFFLLEAASRSHIDRFVASHPYRAARLWRQVLVRPLGIDV